MNQSKKSKIKMTIVESTDSICQLKNGDRMPIAALENQKESDKLRRQAKYGRAEREE